uniref:Ovule protein n=1 Tax=Heterorhabditis bacteriophora TaxID=37862 RepID=A0A1I7XRN2_HETBA
MALFKQSFKYETIDMRARNIPTCTNTKLGSNGDAALLMEEDHDSPEDGTTSICRKYYMALHQ